MYYMFFIGVFFIICSLALLARRVLFLRRCKYTVGTVVVVARRKNDFDYSRRSKSKRVEIKYTGSAGYSKRFVLGSSILVYFYRDGDLIRLAINGNRVFVATWANLLMAPGSFMSLGVVFVAYFANAVF